MGIVDVANKIIEMSAGQNPVQTYIDFLEIMALAHAAATPCAESMQRESQYMKAIAKYKPEDVNKMAEIYADIVCIAESNEKIVDILGPIYEKLEASNKRTGQCFTPYHVTKLMADIYINKEKIISEIESNGHVNIMEPTCGSGVNILAACQRIRELGFNPQMQVEVHANDIDINCVYMTYIQLSMWGIQAVVTHGDALKGVVWQKFKTMPLEGRL